MTAGFASEFNTYYNKACNSFQVDRPTDCADNFDLGLTASRAYASARGPSDDPDGMLLTRTLNAILKGTHPLCPANGICMDWPNTEATVYSAKLKQSGKEDYII